MQELITSFGSLMSVTGAAIAVEKSWFYLVDFVWKKGRWVTYDPGDNYDLVATNNDGDHISLQRLCHSESAEMLGI